ncbi:uncharacterized protein K460DRAFT_268350, partial [Cucurbitaria berberidis CBS 394.84]
PTGAVDSWLDLYPPTASTSNSISTPRKPTTNPKIVARIDEIRNVLADMKITMANRKYFLKLNKYDSWYCTHCTPGNVIGACGHTCPLLRPRDKMYNPPITNGWVQRATADCAAYQEIVDDMDARGNQVYAATVSRWERAVEKLRLSGRTEAERHADLNWSQVPRVNTRAGFKPGWGFEEHWGKGPAACDEIAPD